MSGILPMKVIKVGTSSQSRIAQACDRCRSKKIRCDGVRPCCSQCASVGFECRTSDKLSRRAFPRGYTESLEEKVRSLEAEVRELRELLGEKSEKIRVDVLSSMHASSRASNSPASPTPSAEACAESPLEEDVFHVQTSSLLLGSESSRSLFVSDSSGRAFVDVLKRKIQESGKSCPDFNTEAFPNMQTPPSIRSAKPALEAAHPLPRLFSDRCVQIFFEEWTPLFPVLHRPTFLGIYEEYVSGPERMMNDRELAQLHLVFGIASLSSNMPDKDHVDFCEDQWRASLDSLSMDNTLPTLQNYVLAILYCILKGDRQRLQRHYRGMAVELSHRLGLHQSQKVFSIGALTAETRRKVFWTLYTVECFSSALLGLPTLLAKGSDIQCEYPTAIDDEYVTEEGFLPTLPGELPRISAALALFRVSRILSSVLRQNYHATPSREDSLQSLSALEAELNNWSNGLPSHLKLNFERDKPPTNVRGSRPALLSLSYYYIRSMIHRPAVGSSSGSKASPSIISLADSSKHIVQIVEFLEERSLSFSFCLNKNETLVLCGLSLLYQSLHLKQEGQFVKDEQQPVRAVVRCLEMGQAPMAGDFREVATSIILIDSQPDPRDCQALENKVAMSTAELAASLPVTGGELFHQSSYPSLSLSAGVDILSRQNHHHAAFPKQATKRGRLSLDSARAQPSFPRHEYRSSVSLHPAIANSHFSSSPQPCQNVDYLSLQDGSSTSQSASPSQLRPLHSISHKFGSQLTSPSLTSVSSSCNLNPSPVTPIEWESLYSDSGRSSIFNTMYGSPPNLAPSQSHSHSLQSETLDWAEPPASERTTISNPSFSAYCSNWNPASWGVSTASMHDFGVPQQPSLVDPSAQSALSAREPGLNGGDGRRSSEFAAANGGGGVGDRAWIADMRF